MSDFTIHRKFSYEDLCLLTGAALVAVHNDHAPEDQQVKRFSTKEVALRRTWQAVTRYRSQVREAAREAAATPKEQLEKEGRSNATCRSWENPTTRKLRSARIEIIANGQRYKSVGQAFRDLALEPYFAHIAFRGRLRNRGSDTFTASDGRKVNFAVAEIRESQCQMKS